MTIAKIAIPTPLRTAFDYIAIPGATIGSRVIVPFGKRSEVLGVIIDITDKTECKPNQLKEIITVLDKEPLFNTIEQQLILWASQYYNHPIGEVFAAAVPTWLRKKNNLIAKVKLPEAVPTEPVPFAIELTAEQQQAITTVKQNFNAFFPCLLDGITGSGKTEVYIQLINQALSQGKQTLLLIPEINLTPQTVARFANRFIGIVAVLHSKLTAKTKAVAWLQAKYGHAKIVIGTRSAAMVPLKDPGLFIVDEEHDLSFKQQEGFRYSARDLLIKRAKLSSCPIILGTATPALETWANAKQHKFSRLVLTKRAGGAALPRLELIDIRHRRLQAGLSNQVLAKVKTHLQHQGQVLIFLNRRGFAPVLICYQCGWHQVCNRCDTNMTVHNNNIVKCHYCLAQARVITTCPKCNNENLSATGIGTQKLEEFLINFFPDYKIARVDSDTVQNKQQLQDVLDQVQSGAVNILIGTQMLAKGHHFPNLTLVVIVDIDAALFSADFRAIERMGQVITQVAGRAGRVAGGGGEMLLQTTQPTHHSLNILLTQGYHALLNSLLAERKRVILPPFSYQTLLRARSKKDGKAFEFLGNIKLQAKKLLAQTKSDPGINSLDILGPVTAPMAKKADYHRAQLLLQADNRQLLHWLIRNLVLAIDDMKKCYSLRWSVDVDPLEVF